jgi:tripartite-type tricarboxylate transporter receptor subunit TctC
VKASIRTFIAAVALVFAGPATAQQYPSKTVRIVVPFAAAGPTDVVARLIAQKLSDKFGQQFIVDNVPGAGGNIGMGQVAKAAGDGHTLIVVSSSFVVNPSLYKQTPYDALKDFAPITKAGATPNALIVHPSIPAKSVQELVNLIKASPDKYSIASPGQGTTPSLSIEMFKQTFGLTGLVVVPFKGGSPAINSVVAGHTPISFQAIPPATELIKAGKLRALAITALKRSPVFPDVPTLNELGIKGQEAETMQGVLAPAGTPKPIIELLQREIAAIIKMPDVGGRMLALGFTPEGISSAEFADYIQAELAKWKKVITDAKIPQI